MPQLYFFAKETYTHNISQWLEVMKRGECASILDYSRRGQVYRIEEFLADHQVLAKHFSGKNATKFIKCNLDNYLFADIKELETFLITSINPDSKNVIFVMNADLAITDKTDWLAYLNAYAVGHPNIVMLFFFKKNITAPFYLKKLSHYSTLFQNIIVKKPYEVEDVQEFIKEVQKTFNIAVPEELEGKIIQKCQNKLWLVKEALRYYAKTKDEVHLFDHDEMLLRIQAILNELDPWEYEVVQKVARNEPNFISDEVSILNYFLKTKFIEKKDSTYIVAVPLIREYLDKLLQHSMQIYLDTKHNIIINNVNVNQMFSPGERALFRFLLQNRNTIISREQLAQAVWKEKYYEKYSDWALDQMVKRFRDKMAKLGLNKLTLQTKKNQGFIFSV